jgi:hypothetical protein
MIRKANQFRPVVECLEGRQLMAANAFADTLARPGAATPVLVGELTHPTNTGDLFEFIASGEVTQNMLITPRPIPRGN